MTNAPLFSWAIGVHTKRAAHLSEVGTLNEEARNAVMQPIIGEAAACGIDTAVLNLRHAYYLPVLYLMASDELANRLRDMEMIKYVTRADVGLDIGERPLLVPTT